MPKVALDLSCNTQLACVQCGGQDFRICMECDEDTNKPKSAEPKGGPQRDARSPTRTLLR